MTKNSRLFQVSDEVRQAVDEKRPVIALETTIYTHGFPYPENLALASQLESLVRSNGGVPATIGILEGVARVGLGRDELDRLVSAAKDKSNLLKISRRDLGFALGRKADNGKAYNGGTTISGTMVLAHMAGIRIFGTGGLGGVHRGAETTMDISADLTELGRTPVTVISSGCKAFLDLPKTLEYLETQGVGVATFADGRNGMVDMPAFWSRDSGVPSPVTIKDEAEAARIIYAHAQLGLQSGLHFANPIPDKYSIPLIDMQGVIKQAIEAASEAGATGSANTPFILARIKDLTGWSVEANRSLVESNVVRATQVAKELQKLETEGEDIASYRDTASSSHIIGPALTNFTHAGVSKGVSANVSATSPPQDPSVHTENDATDVFVAGILAVDLACDYTPRDTAAPTSSAPRQPELQTSNPSRISQSLGGVGHNVALAAHRMGASVRLLSAVGNDLTGKAAIDALNGEGMSSAGVKVLSGAGSRTAQYIAVNDTSKDLMLAMADMRILEQENGAIEDAFDNFWLPQLAASRPTHLVLDANWPPTHLHRWLQAGKRANAHITFEPVSNAKATGLFNLPSASTTRSTDILPVYPNQTVDLTTPNSHELRALYTAAQARSLFDRSDWWAVIDALGIPSTGARTQLSLATSSQLVDDGVPQMTLQLLPFIPTILTKLGPRGVLLTQILPAGDKKLTSGEHAPHILSRCRNGSEDEVGVGGVYMRLFPAVEAVKAEDVVSVNGVGDTFAGTLVAGLAAGKGAKVEELVDLAQRAACLTLKSSEAVSPGLGTLRMLL